VNWTKNRKPNIMIRGKVIILVIFCSVIISCFHKRVDNESFVVTKDGDGNLQSEINYLNDKVMHGLAKYYYSIPENVLKDEIEFSKGIKDGWHKHYRHDGTLESKIHWKNNLEDGENFWYYSSGVLEQKSFSIKGRQYGSGYFYYANGKTRLYNCFDSWGENMYVLKYDEQGNKIKEEGMVFSPQFVALYLNDSMQTPISFHTIKAGKEIAIKTTVAQPPHTNTIIRMGEMNKSMSELPIVNYTATLKQSFTKTGKHTLVTVGEMKDLKGNIVKQDTIYTEITVIE